MMRDHGTSEFFYEIVSMIKKYDRENMVYPKQLAAFCNHLSKLSNNVGGGFGLYKITEDKLGHYLPKMDFHELANICQLLVPQMACSKELVNTLMDRLIDQITRFDKLEESILNRKIEIDPTNLETYDLKITVGDLVRLLKAFSSYQYRGRPLIEKLLARIVYYVPGMSNQQIESVLWSLTKGSFANGDLYKALEKQFSRRLPSLSFRGLSFSFTEFAEYGQLDPQLYLRYLKEIKARAKSQDAAVSVHYYLLIFKGIVHSGYVLNNEMLEKVEIEIKDLTKQILGMILQKLEVTIDDSRLFKVRDIMKITDLFREGMNTITADPRLQSIFQKLESLFLLNYKAVDKSGIIGLESEEDEYLIQTGGEPEFSFDDLCRVFVNYSVCNLGSRHFMDQLTAEINSKVVMITKRSFCSTFFALVNSGRCENPQLFSAIIYELHKYGDFKYFFSHRDFIKLVWSLLSTHFQGQYQVCDYPLDKAFLVLSPYYLDSQTVDGLENDEIFEQNFEIMKQLAKVTRSSTADIIDTLLAIDPNTLDAYHLRLNIQSAAMLDFLLRGQQRSAVVAYVAAVNEHLTDSLLLQAVDRYAGGHAAAMARQAVEAKMADVEGVSARVIVNFVDECSTVYDLCVEVSPTLQPESQADIQSETSGQSPSVLPFTICINLWSPGFHTVPFEQSRLQGMTEASLMTTAFGNNTHVCMLANDIDMNDTAKAVDAVVDRILALEQSRKQTIDKRASKEAVLQSDAGKHQAKGRKATANRKRPKKPLSDSMPNKDDE